MTRYAPCVGGYRWNELLARNRQRNEAVADVLRRLERAATTDATRVLILQAQVAVTENLVDLGMLMGMARGGEAGGE